MPTKTEEKALPTQNEAWGFWGTMRQRGLPVLAIQAAWEQASAELIAELGISREQARFILDARMGRHMADQVDVKASGKGAAAMVKATFARLLGHKGWRKEVAELAAEADISCQRCVRLGRELPHPAEKDGLCTRCARDLKEAV